MAQPGIVDDSNAAGCAMTKVTTETLGMTVEKVICDQYGLDASAIHSRASPRLERRVSAAVRAACEELPPIKRWVGLQPGQGGGQSKSPVDFEFVDGRMLSVKTTRSVNGKVCPPECGQPGAETFEKCFGHLYEGRITPEKFKQLCLTRFHEMLPIYIDRLFDCDYLLWLWCSDDQVGFRVIPREVVRGRRWSKEDFKYTQSLETWNESCTVKCRYGGGELSLGEFQAHRHRSPYKFRFILKNLCRVLVD